MEADMAAMTAHILSGHSVAVCLYVSDDAKSEASIQQDAVLAWNSSKKPTD